MHHRASPRTTLARDPLVISQSLYRRTDRSRTHGHFEVYSLWVVRHLEFEVQGLFFKMRLHDVSFCEGCEVGVSSRPLHASRSCSPTVVASSGASDLRRVSRASLRVVGE